MIGKSKPKHIFYHHVWTLSYSQNEECLLLHWEQKRSEVVLEIYIYILASIQHHRQIENAFVTSNRWRYPQPTHILMSLHWEDMQCGRSSKLPPSVERVPKLRTQVQSEIYLQAIVCSVCLIKGMKKKSSALDFSSSSICLPFYQLMGHVTTASRILAPWSRWAYLQGQRKPDCPQLPLWSDEEKWFYCLWL